MTISPSQKKTFPWAQDKILFCLLYMKVWFSFSGHWILWTSSIPLHITCKKKWSQFCAPSSVSVGGLMGCTLLIISVRFISSLHPSFVIAPFPLLRPVLVYQTTLWISSWDTFIPLLYCLKKNEWWVNE